MPDIGEQAISKVVEAGLSSQLDEVEGISVDIRTDPGKVVQGEVDSVSIQGKGMVMQKDLRMQKMDAQTGSVAINPLDLRNFELEGISLRLKGLDVQKGSMTLQVEAHVEQIPSA